MQRRHHHLRRRNLLPVNVHIVHGNPPPIIYDSYAVVDVDGHFDFCGEAGEGFIDGVVDYFIDEVVQAEVAGGADVHRGTLAHSFHAAEDFD